ncbi:MAG: 30S ribosomal protein S20 [Alphaproteobacteria bacterium RIFOXYD12_FULL_60_8]|nr:MAG: 30S ribosomal protein S20 [Alphaproteobacteria bacterium RIFOXYD12_FULL_60_8]
MANHHSAKTRIRRNERAREINHSRLSGIRTWVKKVETAIASGDKASATEAFKAAQPQIARGVSKGILHRNTASRKISRLSSRIKALNA